MDHFFPGEAPPTRALSAHEKAEQSAPPEPSPGPPVYGTPEEGPGGLALSPRPARSAPLRPAGPASSARPAPPTPYQGFGYVSPLGDVFAVLLVSHPDPLFGHHGLGAWRCSRLPPARMAGVSRCRRSPRPARALQVARRGRAPHTPLPEPQPAGSRERPARGRK